MTTTFPTTLDTLVSPTMNSNMNDAGLEHDVLHTNINDAVIALQAKMGVNGSAVISTVDYILSKKQGVTTFTSPPTLATSTGIQGQIIVSGGFVYFCIATNSWVRSAVAVW